MKDNEKISKILNESKEDIKINIKDDKEINILEKSLIEKEEDIKDFFSKLLKEK